MITFIIILFFSIIFFIVKITITESNKKGIGYQVGIKFIKQYNPNINEEVKFWYNENQNIVYIYLKGTAGGQGKIGTINNKKDIQKILNNETKATIKSISEDTIYLNFTQ